MWVTGAVLGVLLVCVLAVIVLLPDDESAGRMDADDVLERGDRLESAEGRQVLEMTTSGRLEASSEEGIWWFPPNDPRPGAIARMQDDGNFVIYRTNQEDDAEAAWSSETWENDGGYLIIRDENGVGFLEIRSSDDNLVKRLGVSTSPTP